MSWIKDTINSSIGRKIVMGLTGLMLIGFLLTHLAGNVSLLFDDGGEAFNAYAHFMKHNKLIFLGELVLFALFIFHIVQGINLVIKNKKSRPVGYAVATKSKTENWSSKYMGALGIIIMIFLFIHLYDFFRFKYFAEAPFPDVTLASGEKATNLYAVVHKVYTEDIIRMIIYPLAMLAIAFHLYHGFQSAFQTFGWNHPKYTPLVKKIGVVYSILVPLAFALIPILIKAGVLI